MVLYLILPFPESIFPFVQGKTEKEGSRMFMKKMIAYCGLDCEKCEAYLATVNDDQALRVKTAELWSKLNHASITPEQINCLGCRAEGVKTIFCESLCSIRQCARKKDVETCCSCPEKKKCPVLDVIISNHPEARENLKA